MVLDMEDESMTPKQALTASRRLFGSRGMVRDRGIATSPETRASGKAEVARLLTLLDAGQRGLGDQIMRARAQSMRYRYAVGLDEGIGLYVLGQGDSWEEAIESASHNEEGRA